MEAHAKKYSPGYKKDLVKGTSWTFWAKDFDAMAYKTMLRQLISKWGIMSIDLQDAMDSDMAVIREDGSPAYHRIFDGGFPYHIGLLFQEKDDFSSNRRSKARSDLFAGNYYTKAFTHSQEHPDPEVPHN